MKLKKITILLVVVTTITTGYSQMTATFNKTINTICNGSGCDYNGPSILINEIQVAPNNGDGSLSGNQSDGIPPLVPPVAAAGEWIELYNPNICEPVDISCYYLGNAANDPSGPYGGGFQLPANTIVPPGGFCVVRGANAPAVPTNLLVANGGNTVEVIVPVSITGNGVCVGSGGHRLWFPNAGGWFAFYDRNGQVQDAISWGDAAGSAGLPCIPTSTGCNTGVTSLASYTNIPANRKQNIYSSAVPKDDLTIRRMPDGGAWATDVKAPATYGTCNDVCATLGTSSCDATATINVSGGNAPYSYLWNDSEAQLTQTATGLCAGTYNVTVTDANNATQTFTVTIENYVPTVTFAPQTSVCNEGQTVALSNYSPTPTSGQTGVFTGTGVSGTSFNVATAGNGTFPIIYTFTDENGCENADTSSITVNPKPVPTISGVDPTYCLSNTTVTPTLSPAGGTLSGPGVTGNTINIFNAGPGTHTIKYVVTNQFGCSDSTTVSFTVTTTTPPTFSVQNEICLGAAPIALIGTPAGGTFNVGTQTITQFDPAQFGLGQHVITYTITDPNNPGCLAQASDTIKVINGGTITTNTPTYFCFNSPDYNVVMNPAGGTLTGSLISGNTLQVANATPGAYSFTYDYTSAQGCHSSYTHNFTIGSELTVQFQASVDCFQTVTLTATPANYASYNWLDGTTAIGTGNPLVYTAQTAGDHTYALTAADANGCQATTSAIVNVPTGVTAENFNIPNIITPNGDGVNDFVVFPLMDLECINYKVTFVNRWGHPIFEASKDNPIFYGKDKKGTELSDGVYFYKIVSDDFNCKEEPYKSKCHGFITIQK